jgi:wobble nucleotide-excising tRNase
MAWQNDAFARRIGMINNIRLLRSVGQFDNTAAATLAFRPLTLIYAENGRGKTTVSAIFRSLPANELRAPNLNTLQPSVDVRIKKSLQL